METLHNGSQPCLDQIKTWYTYRGQVNNIHTVGRVASKRSEFMRRLIKFLVAFSILFLATADAGWQSRKETFESVDSATIRQLFKDGPFMVIKRRTKTNLPEVISGIIIEAEPQRVWKVVTDYQRRPEIIRGVLKVEDLKRDGNKTTFKQRNFIKFSFIKFAWDEHRTYEDYPDKKLVVFAEAIKPEEAVGGYELIPLDGSKATLLLYSYIADLTKMGFPVGNLAREMPLVEETLMTSAAIMVVTGIKEYSEKQR